METSKLVAEVSRRIGYAPSKYQIGILEWVLKGEGNGACNAVAGAGKSSSLRMVAIALELLGLSPYQIRVIVFGKENSKELINKFGVGWKASISTLHSAGFSLLKKELDIKDNRDIQLSDGKYKRIAEDLELIGKRGSRGKLHEDGAVGKDSEFLRLVNLIRLTNNYPTAQTVRDLCHHFEVEDIYEYSIVASAIADCLRIGEQKARNKEIIDFTDQIWLPMKWEIYKRRWFKPYKFVLCDEAQDLNAIGLELAIGLAGSSGRLLFVGDPCQPADTKVLVVHKRGSKWGSIVTKEIPISELKEGDTVYSYSASDGHFYSSAKVTGISKRHFDGELVIASLPSGQKSKYTPNHHCIASFAPFRNHYCVYLMQKEQQFRIGMSKITVGESRGTGPVARLRQEKADAVWILDFYPDRDRAYIAEQAIAGKFGLPQLVFCDASVKTKQLVKQAWEFIGSNYTRAEECLSYFGRDIRYPLFKAGKNWQQSLKRPMVVQASNLIDGCLMLPFSNKQQAYSQDWQPAKIQREKYTGDVYSLDVEKYHTYVADGIVTHNCQAIMGFAGADNRSYQKILERTKATELPLSTCYRCPRSHIDLVRRQFPNIPIEAKEDANFGEIQQVEEKDLEQHLRVGDRVISRKTAPLVSQCIKLIAKGIPATVKGRAIGETIKRDLEEIASMPGFKYENFHLAVSEYRSLKALKYKEMDNEEQLIQNLNDKLEALQTIYISQPQAKGVADLSSYIDSLFSDDHSPITLSTCHRAKGLEGDRIFILKPEDMPMTWRNQLEWQKEQEDNLLYVALTRSKSELFVVGQPAWLPRAEEEDGDRDDTLPLELNSSEERQTESTQTDSFVPEIDLDDPDFILHTAELCPEDEDDDPTEANDYPEFASYIREEVEKKAALFSLDTNEQEELASYLGIEEVAQMGDLAPSINPPSVNSLQLQSVPRTNAEKRQLVAQVLKDKEWQGKSDRAIAKHCGVSAPFVGNIRAELEAEGTLGVSTERVDRKGRRINTVNIGTKPKQPEVKESANSSNSPSKLISARLRIEGETKEDLDAIALLLQHTFEVVEESQDYPNRTGYGIRRYLTVRVVSYQSISMP